MMFIGLFVAAKVGYSFMNHNTNNKAGCKKSEDKICELKALQNEVDDKPGKQSNFKKNSFLFTCVFRP